MADKFKAGLDDQDELGQFPSAANPLTAMGVDPDTVASNPDMLARLSGGGSLDAPSPLAQPGMPGAVPDTSDLPANSDRRAKVPFPASTPTLDDSDTAKPSPSAPSATGISDSPTDPEGYGMEGLGLLSKNLKQATDAAGEMSTKTPDDVSRLSAEQARLGAKTPLRDASGKILDQYKPSAGSRIWRGVRGGLVGLAGGGISGAIAGAVDPSLEPGGKAYGAPNKQYERAEDTREQQLGSTNEQLGTAMKTWKDAVDAAKAKSGEYRANAALGKDLTTGATGLINAENKPETEDNKTKAKLALTQQEFDLRSKQLQTDPTLSKLSPINKALYLANGKVPDPKEPNEAEINAAQIARGMTIFKAQHGGKGPQTLEEFNSVISAAKGDLGKGKGAGGTTEAGFRQIEDKKDIEIQRALASYAKDPGQPETIGELQSAIQLAQNQYEADMAIAGREGPHQVVSVDKDGQVKWTPQTGAAPAAPAAPAQPTTPKPSPDGTRIKLSDGTIQIKRGGKWVNE